jgi:hypothetical protein
MPILKSIQSGNFTNSSTWGVIDPGSYTFSQIGLNVTGGGITSANFTVSSNITISGISLRIASRAVTPSGTMTVTFRNVTTSTDLKSVMVNISDIPQGSPNGFSVSVSIGWMFFKFDVPITLNNTQSYQIRVSTSVNSQVSIYSASSNVFDKFLVTTTNATPGANDFLFIVGENISPGVSNRITVTMNNTSSVVAYEYSVVDVGGTLRWADTPSSTFHLRLVNSLEIKGNGEVIIGDDAAPIPSSTTCSLEITCSSPIQFRIFLASEGKLITRGAETTVKSEISGNISAGVNTFNTAITTDWVAGDRIVVAGTSVAGLQNELRTISSRSGDTINTTTNFSFAHLGTGDVVADVGKLNRNVRIFSTSPTNPAHIFGGGVYASLNLNYTEIYDMGHTNTTTQSALLCTQISATIRNCSIYNTTSRNIALLFYDNSSGSMFIDNNFFYFSGISAIFANRFNVSLLSTVPYTISNNLSIQTSGFSFPINGDFNNNTICGAPTGNSVGMTINSYFSGTMDNTKIYTMTRGVGTGGDLNVNNLTVNGGTVINNLKSFRNINNGIQFSSLVITNLPLIFNNAQIFGNVRAFDLSVANVGRVIFKDSFFYGGTGEVAQTLYVRQNLQNPIWLDFAFENCKFGLNPNNNPSNFTAPILNISGSNYVLMNNCIFSGTENSSSNVFELENYPGIVSLNHNGVTGAIRVFKSSGIMIKDTSIVTDKPSSVRLVPQSATINALSDAVKIPVKTGQVLTISVKVRKSAAPDTAYNGTQPRLIYVYNQLNGNLSNTVAATATSSNGVWETLTYTTLSALIDTVLEFYVLCNGTAGFINISDWAVNIYNNTKNNEHYGINGLYIEPGFRYPGISHSSVF